MKINTEFERLIPPLSKEEFEQLEKNILAEGIRDALITWNGFLVDGHNRYEIAQRYDLTYQTIERQFNSEDDAKQWIISNQLGRRNITDFVKYELHKAWREIEEKKGREVRKQTEGRPSKEELPSTIDNSLPKHDTRAKLAEKLNWSTGKVAMTDVVDEKADEVTKEKLRKNEVTINEVYQEIKNAGKIELIEKRKEEYLAASSAGINNKPIIHKSDCITFLDTIENDSIDLLLTDPPYSTDIKDLHLFVAQWVTNALTKVKKNGRAFICIGAYPNEIEVYLSFLLRVQKKFIVDNPLIWTYKNTLGVTPKMKYNLNYQMILHLYSDQSSPLDTSVTNEMFSVQDINAPDGRLGDRFHTWQKPDELAMRLVKHSTKEGDTVLDCFACTGTFLLAAAKLGRKTIGCDISAENLEIAKQRGCVIA